MGRNVGRRAVERGMAEREQTARAEQQIERAGEQREAQDLRQKQRIQEIGRDNKYQRADDRTVGPEPRVKRRRSESVTASPQRSRPNKPAGCTSRTTIMMTKITMFAPGG